TAAAPEACQNPTPVCDDAQNTCTACTAHEQCGDAACNLYTGECLPGDAVVHVGPGRDFENLAAAVASFTEPDAQGTLIVHQGSDYNEAITVGDTRVLAFLAADDVTAPPGWVLTGGGGPQLTVPAGSTVLLDGLRLSGNSDNVALLLDGGQAWVDRSRIIQNAGGGIVANNGAELTVRNCFVGSSTPDVDAIALNNSSLDVLYTTVGGGGVLGGRAR